MKKNKNTKENENPANETPDVADVEVTTVPSDATKLPKRLVIKQMIEDGGCTKKSILEATGISSASLATNFTYLRLMGHYPLTDKDGVLSFTDADGWAEIQSEKALNAKSSKVSKSTKTPQTQYEQLVARVAKLETAADKAKKLASESDDQMVQLRNIKADADLGMARITLQDLLNKFSDVINFDVFSNEDPPLEAYEESAPSELV